MGVYDNGCVIMDVCDNGCDLSGDCYGFTAGVDWWRGISIVILIDHCNGCGGSAGLSSFIDEFVDGGDSHLFAGSKAHSETHPIEDVAFACPVRSRDGIELFMERANGYATVVRLESLESDFSDAHSAHCHQLLSEMIIPASNHQNETLDLCEGRGLYVYSQPKGSTHCQPDSQPSVKKGQLCRYNSLVPQLEDNLVKPSLVYRRSCNSSKRICGQIRLPR